MIRLGLAVWSGAEILAQALAEAGLQTVNSEADLLVLSAGPMEREEVLGHVDFVVGGGGLLICGGDGPLLRALHLLPQEGPVPGPVVPAAPGLAPVELDEAWPVSGAGYALYRAGERCVALGAPRARGAVAYLGSPDPAPALAVACLGWISRQMDTDVRSMSGEASI